MSCLAEEQVDCKIMGSCHGRNGHRHHFHMPEQWTIILISLLSALAIAFAVSMARTRH
jgi:hypothetical protein